MVNAKAFPTASRSCSGTDLGPCRTGRRYGGRVRQGAKSYFKGLPHAGDAIGIFHALSEPTRFSCSHDARLDLLFDLGAHCAFGDVEIVTGLKIDPELRRRPKIAPQAQCGVGRDAAASEH